MERDVLSLLKIDEELVAVKATLCWWGRRLVGWGWGQRRTAHGPPPHSTHNLLAALGQRKREFLVPFMVPPPPPDLLGAYPWQTIRVFLWQGLSFKAAFRERLSLCRVGRGGMGCLGVLGAGGTPRASLGQRALVLSLCCFGLS